MKIAFTNLIKASEFGNQSFRKNVLNGISKLIFNNQFVGGQQVDEFEKNFQIILELKIVLQLQTEQTL